MKKRFLTMFLAILLVVSLVPMAAMADCTCGLANGDHAEYAGEGKHNIVCEHGKVVLTTWCNADGEDGACTACGNKKTTTPAEPVVCTCNEAMGMGAEYVGGGKHNVLCEHKNVVNTTWCNDIDGDGYCDACLNKMEAEVEKPEKCECTEGMGVKAEYVGDGKHNIICAHGNVVNTTWCSKGDDGKCIGCGHVMEETEPEDPNPEEKPEEKPTVDSKGLDNVPKTGDNGSLIVVTSMTVLAAIAGVAFVFNKKKAF